MSVFSKILRAGEGKKVRALQALVPDINELERETEALSDEALAHRTVEFRERLDRGEDVNDMLVEAFADRPGSGPADHRPAPLRRAADGWSGPALRVDRRDEDRRGQDPRLDPPGVSQRPHRQGRPPGHRQRLPGPARRRVDGSGPPLPRHRRRPGVARDRRLAGQEGRLRLRRDLRHQHRVRVRLPARQHGPVAGAHGAAGPPLRHRRRGRLHPDRRGPHPTHHFRSVVGIGPPVLPVRRRGSVADGRGRLRGGRGKTDGRADRGRDREGRAGPRHRQPLRPRVVKLRPPADPGPQGQGALQAGQGLHRRRRRSEDRRRVHRAHPGRAALVRRPPPGGRGQRAGDHQGGKSHLGHGHPAELLPPLREAGRHDRHGRDRGFGVRQHL